MASLICLVVVSGCSNIRQQSLELPLPILPSENATATETNGEERGLPLLTNGGSIESASTAERLVDKASAWDQAAFKNDFDASEFEQSPSVRSFLPSESDFQPQQPRARFVGLLEKADNAEIKLTAITDKAAPAPAITKASHENEIENCETPEVCDANATARCECCKKKELPKFAVVEPMDPEQMPELFGNSQATSKRKAIAPLELTLRPLQATNVAAEPIRLTVRQDSESVEVKERSAIAESTQTKNKAHLLIPIAPAELQALKTDIDQTKSQEAPAVAASRTIKVSPIMDIHSAPAKNLFALPAHDDLANVANAKQASVTTESDQSKLIPVSSSGIRVSAVPFRSLPIPLSTPVVAAAEPIVEPEPIDSGTAQTPDAVPEPEVAPIEIVKPVEIVEPAKQQVLSATSNDFAPQLTISAKPIENAAAEQLGVDEAIKNEITKSVEQNFQVDLLADEVIDQPSELVAATSSADIDPLADISPPAELSGLPDMSQIEKELAEFERWNTFDPSTVIESDTIDPTVLLAKLDGPPKSIATPAPVAKVVEATSNNELITQQLAEQSSALLELQDAINQLKPKPVTVSSEAPELMLRNAAFCTKISGFGQFKPFAANDFSSSQKTLLYCEVENQTSKQFTSIDGSQQYETVLHGSIVIYDANDQIVQTAKFPAIKDVARHQRRDFYVYFPVQFDELAHGDYRLELNVEDGSAGKAAVLRPFMRFSIR